MKKEEFDKLIGKVVRIHRGHDIMTMMVIESFQTNGKGSWYYCYDEYTWFMGLGKIAINRKDVTSAEILPKEEEIIWRIKNGV
jgi:hypothetical protein